MSQIIKNLASGPVPPSVATLYTEDVGTATPALNNLNVLGDTGIATSGSGSTITISIQNGSTDQAQTIGATTADITTIPLTVAGTYTFETRASAWESTGPSGAGFSINGVIRSDGVTATLIGDSDGFTHQDTALNASDVNIIASGNNAIVRVLGVAGLTVNWGAFTVYVFRGA